jgi:hypothetical protein
LLIYNERRYIKNKNKGGDKMSCKKVNLNELLEEVVDERVHASLCDDGFYYMEIVEENGDVFLLTKEKTVEEVYKYLSNWGLC